MEWVVPRNRCQKHIPTAEDELEWILLQLTSEIEPLLRAEGFDPITLEHGKSRLLAVLLMFDGRRKRKIKRWLKKTTFPPETHKVLRNLCARYFEAEDQVTILSLAHS